jgi:hypothetical protein
LGKGYRSEKRILRQRNSVVARILIDVEPHDDLVTGHCAGTPIAQPLLGMRMTEAVFAIAGEEVKKFGLMAHRKKTRASDKRRGMFGETRRLRTQADRGRPTRAVVSSTTQINAAIPNNFRLFGVRGPPRGMSVATRTAFLGFAGL